MDTELHREVALKQILDSHADDDTSRHRFLLEAEITGGLEHPGIVPVYGLGAYGDGRPYYAMRFIRGDSLKEAIEQFHRDGSLRVDPGRRSLELRKLLRRFLDVCNAIDYAHSRGVLHRDIKPGNIIVGQHGETLVVDWGLAKAVGRSEPGSGERTLRPSSASGSAETLPGTALGTPAYMSPEQAGGDLDRLGPRSDVYSLGATLYCLLAGKPPLEGDVADVLRAVQKADFRPPRQIDASIDRGLEAVCLKAMALRPEDRYATPKGLAEDVERWMADEPVSAWREPISRRVRRWMQRNRTAVAAAAVALVAGVIGLGAVTGVQARANSALRKANDETKAALAETKEAKEATDAALTQSEENARRAEANAKTARRAVNDYLDRVTTSPQLQRPGLSGLRRDLLNRALSYYENFLRESTADPELRAEAADAQNRAGMILAELGETSKAVAAGERAVALNEQLVHDQPDKPAHRHRLAAALNTLGNALRTTRQSDEALAAYRRSAETREALLRTEPDNIDCATDLAVAWSNVAKTLGNVGREKESEALLVRLRTHLEELIRRVPDSGRARDLLADTLHSLGNLAADREQFEAARSLYQRSLELREAMVREHPDDWAGQSQLARINNELGLLHFHFNHPEEALRYYEKSRELRERLLAAEPASAELQEYLARSLENLGNLQNSLTNYSAALPVLERCRELRARLATASPGNAEMQGRLGGSLHNLAMSHEGLKHDAEAERLYREAIECQRRARAIQPEVVVHRAFFTNHLLGLGGLRLRAGKADEAAKLALEAAAFWTTEPQPLLRSALLLASCAGAAGSKDSPEAKARKEGYGRSAVELLDKAAVNGFRNLDFFRSSKELDPIRDREDFKSMVRRLESSSAPSK